ncbi:MAG: NADH-ubiquinone oxidoreductase chain N [Cytophagales bacterium]|jgi:NADH-quinone oxidoreductase subunit N|nr:NADH-quinone oxidoreductase subunit N [Bacteroidota bacterium]MBS1980860.1 NADH-quinone oxidoreductase subunit N [Bacteroidota bacterium]WHZ08207.1 MAG: NADH-ubiquinone oxidoreductase chain N [Cytophagales bacterium]
MEFSNINIIDVLPGLFLVVASVLAMISIAIKRNHIFIFVVTSTSLMGVFLFLILYASNHEFNVEPLFVIDGFGTFVTGLIVMSALAVSLLSYAYFEQREERKEEYYILLLLATLGSDILVISKHFVSLFLGLEILSISLYAMVAYLRKRNKSDEAGLKYLILAAFSSAFLLFGMALVYSASGSMDFTGIAKYVSANPTLPLPMFAGMCLMVVGIGFKLGVVPFHMWAPDVYEGAPAPVAAFIASISKGGMVVLLVRFFDTINGFQYPVLVLAFACIAVASMIAGNVLAIQQTNVKRILAYSSIAHMGYILVAFLAGGELGEEAVSFYLVAYFLTNIGAFGVVAILSDQDRDAERLEDYQGLFWRHPKIAAVFTAMLLSLAGIPLTAGFLGKFYLITSGVHAQLWWLVIVLVASSVIGLYYYIRIIAMMFEKAEGSDELALHPRLYLINLITLLVLCALIIYYGIYPQGLIEQIHNFLQ